jgi:hypothetical protein
MSEQEPVLDHQIDLGLGDGNIVSSACDGCTRSLGVPAEFIRAVGFKPGDKVCIHISPGRLVIRDEDHFKVTRYDSSDPDNVVRKTVDGRGFIMLYPRLMKQALLSLDESRFSIKLAMNTQAIVIEKFD